MDPIDEKIIERYHEINEILNEWGLTSVKRNEKKNDIIKWLHNFEPSEFEEAFLILKKIQYRDSHWVDDRIADISQRLRKYFKGNLPSIRIFPLGESSSSSGSLFLYRVRKSLDLSEETFPCKSINELDLKEISTLVFFDDIIGSGNQAIEFAEQNLSGININKIDKYYCAVLGFTKGIDKIKKSGYFKDVLTGKELSEEYRAFSPNSSVFPEKGKRKNLKRLCGKYGKRLYLNHPLGYDNSQALIVFHHNVPDNTLPIIWASNDNEKEKKTSWHPLWNRTKNSSVQNKSKTPFNLQYKSNPNFTGRKLKLTKLHELLMQEVNYNVAIIRTQAISGLGGEGKTQLAVEYAYRYQESYPNGILWVGAEAGIAYAMAKLAEPLGLRLDEQMSDKDKAVKVQHHLNNISQPCLLIIDNAEDFEQIDKYMPKEGLCRLLVTTRNPLFGGQFSNFELGVLPKEEACELLLKESKRNPSTKDELIAAQDIALLLGCLPIALEMAGKYLGNDNIMPLTEYRQILIEKGLLKHSSLNKLRTGKLFIDDHVASIRATLDINQKIKEDKLAMKLLQTMSIMYPEEINPSLLACAAGLDYQKQKEEFFDSLTLLFKYSIIKKYGDNRYSIHRLQLEVVRDDIGKKQRNILEEKLGKGLAEWVGREYEEYGRVKNKLRKVKEEIPQLIQAAYISIVRNTWPANWDLVYYLGRYYIDMGDGQAALEWYDKAQIIVREKAPNDKYKKSKILNGKGCAYRYLGEYNKALSYFQRALKLRQQNNKTTEKTMIINNIGYIWKKLGENQKALDYFKQALKIDRKLKNSENKIMAVSRDLQNVGSAWWNLGKYQKSLKYCKQALDLRKTVYKEDDIHIANSLQSIGLAYRSLGEYKKAEDDFLKALDIYREFYGEDNHQEIALILHNIGWNYVDLSAYHKALNFYEQALEVRRKILKEDHQDIAASLKCIGLCWVNLGEHQKGLKICEEAFEIFQNAYGNEDNHPYFATVKSNIALAWERIGNYQKALSFYKEALRINENYYDQKHPEIATDLSNIGKSYYNLKEYNKALNYYEQALNIDKKVYQKQQHPYIARDLHYIALIWFKLDKNQKALRYCKQALEIRMAKFGKEHSHTKETRNLLADIQVCAI